MSCESLRVATLSTTPYSTRYYGCISDTVLQLQGTTSGYERLTAAKQRRKTALVPHVLHNNQRGHVILVLPPLDLGRREGIMGSTHQQ